MLLRVLDALPVEQVEDGAAVALPARRVLQVHVLRDLALNASMAVEEGSSPRAGRQAGVEGLNLPPEIVDGRHVVVVLIGVLAHTLVELDAEDLLVAAGQALVGVEAEVAGGLALDALSLVVEGSGLIAVYDILVFLGDRGRDPHVVLVCRCYSRVVHGLQVGEVDAAMAFLAEALTLWAELARVGLQIEVGRRVTVNALLSIVEWSALGAGLVLRVLDDRPATDIAPSRVRIQGRVPAKLGDQVEHEAHRALLAAVAPVVEVVGQVALHTGVSVEEGCLSLARFVDRILLRPWTFEIVGIQV